MEVEWILEIAPILIFIISTILVYGAFKRLGIIGSNTILIILSLAVSTFILIITGSTDLLTEIIHYSVLIFVIGFFIILTIAFLAKDLSIFKNLLSYISIAAIALIVLVLLFNQHPDLTNFIQKDLFQNFIFAVVVIVASTILIKS